MLLQSCLGMRVDASRGQVSFSHPVLPAFLQEVRLKGVVVGEASVDLALLRHENDVGITILRRSGPVDVVVLK